MAGFTRILGSAAAAALTFAPIAAQAGDVRPSGARVQVAASSFQGGMRAAAPMGAAACANGRYCDDDGVFGGWLFGGSGAISPAMIAVFLGVPLAAALAISSGGGTSP